MLVRGARYRRQNVKYRHCLVNQYRKRDRCKSGGTSGYGCGTTLYTRRGASKRFLQRYASNGRSICICAIRPAQLRSRADRIQACCGNLLSFAREIRFFGSHGTHKSHRNFGWRNKQAGPNAVSAEFRSIGRHKHDADLAD